MKPIKDAWLIEIEITNKCNNRCAHCTRSIRHYEKPYFASLEFIEKALKSLKGWKKGVGCIGGEPTLHPEFEKICKLYNKYFPKEQCGIFTTGGKMYEKYKKIIHETFGIINYNEHLKGTCRHQPILVASEEVIKDEKLRKKLIDNCWIQIKWSPTISNRGAFFCEVGAMFDMLFKMDGGYPIEEGWWKRPLSKCNDQIERYCRLCSAAIPFPSFPDDYKFELVSKKNYERLLKINSPYALKRELKIIDVNLNEKIIEKMKDKATNQRYNKSKKGFFYIFSDASKKWRKNENKDNT